MIILYTATTTTTTSKMKAEMARRADFYLGVLVWMYFSVGREVIKVQPEKYYFQIILIYHILELIGISLLHLTMS